MNENPDNKSFKIQRNQYGQWCVYQWHTFQTIPPEWRLKDAFDYRYQARRYVKNLLKILNTKPEYY